MMYDTAIAFENLTVFYTPQGDKKKTIRLVHADNLTILKGACVALLGPSGSGKSTLLRAINRLNECWEFLETEGQVFLSLSGIQYALYPSVVPGSGKIPLDFLRQRVGMVFQHPQILPLTIAKNMLMPLTEGKGLSRKEAEEKMCWALTLSGLWDEVKDRLKSPAGRLSGGQMQRLCLARTLALEPEILLLDEPTASLDMQSTELVEQTITSLRKHMTIVLVTHSPEQANRLADRQFIVQNGVLLNPQL